MTDTDTLRERIRDEVEGIVIGSGYYSMAIGIDAAGEVADAVLAVVRPAIREAQVEAWADCAGEAEALGWLHDYAHADMIDRNTYRDERSTDA